MSLVSISKQTIFFLLLSVLVVNCSDSPVGSSVKSKRYTVAQKSQNQEIKEESPEPEEDISLLDGKGLLNGTYELKIVYRNDENLTEYRLKGDYLWDIRLSATNSDTGAETYLVTKAGFMQVKHPTSNALKFELGCQEYQEDVYQYAFKFSPSTSTSEQNKDLRIGSIDGQSKLSQSCKTGTKLLSEQKIYADDYGFDIEMKDSQSRTWVFTFSRL